MEGKKGKEIVLLTVSLVRTDPSPSLLFIEKLVLSFRLPLSLSISFSLQTRNSLYRQFETNNQIFWQRDLKVKIDRTKEEAEILGWTKEADQ